MEGKLIYREVVIGDQYKNYNVIVIEDLWEYNTLALITF